MNEFEINEMATRTAAEILALEEQKLDRIRAEERDRIRSTVEEWRDETIELLSTVLRRDLDRLHGEIETYNRILTLLDNPA